MRSISVGTGLPSRILPDQRGPRHGEISRCTRHRPATGQGARQGTQRREVATWYVNWTWGKEDPAGVLRPVGLLPITLFGAFVTTR